LGNVVAVQALLMTLSRFPRYTGDGVNRTFIKIQTSLIMVRWWIKREGDILFYLHNGDIELGNVDIQNNSPAGAALGAEYTNTWRLPIWRVAWIT
jgi:hypothetical protein